MSYLFIICLSLLSFTKDRGSLYCLEHGLAHSRHTDNYICRMNEIMPIVSLNLILTHFSTTRESDAIKSNLLLPFIIKNTHYQYFFSQRGSQPWVHIFLEFLQSIWKSQCSRHAPHQQNPNFSQAGYRHHGECSPGDFSVQSGLRTTAGLLLFLSYSLFC